jgi:spermidine synthase
MRVGVVGLGTGTLAAYGQRSDYYRFYEINPDIIDLALGNNGFYSYIKDSPASIEVVQGDARLSLEDELTRGQPQNFDILAVDAFSGDSIPVHLLTAEAFGLYLRHLKPEGVLAMHISNRYLELAPLISGLADRYQLDHALIFSHTDNDGSYAASWVLLSKNRAFFQIPEIADNKDTSRETTKAVRVWTDDYSNLLPFVRMEGVFNSR